MPYKTERKPGGKTLERLQRNSAARGAANMMNDADDDSLESDDMVWDWSEQGRNYRRNALNRVSLRPSWQGMKAAFEDMKKTVHGQSELSGESSDMLKIKSDGSHADGMSLTEFQVRPNLLPTMLSLATQFGMVGESHPPSRYVADCPAWFRRPQTAVTVYDAAQRQARAQQRLQQVHQTPGWGHQFAAAAQRNVVDLVLQFFEAPTGIAGIRRRDPVASYERGEQPAAAHAINEFWSQQPAPAQDMGRNATVPVQEPASVLSSTEGGSSWVIVSQGASAASRGLVWLWNYGGNQTPSGGVDAAPVRTKELGAPETEKEIFQQDEFHLHKMLISPDLSKRVHEVDQLTSEMISMMEKKPDLGAFLDQDTFDFTFGSLRSSAPPIIADSLTRLRDSLPDASKIFSMLVEMLGRKDTLEYDEEILENLIVKSTYYSLVKSEALMQHERKRNLIHRIHELYGLQEEIVRGKLDQLLSCWRSATASLDNVTLINTLKSVFLSERLYHQEYKVELLEAGKNALDRFPGLRRKFGVADIGRLRAAADRESMQIESLLRAFADQVESCLAPESGTTDFSIDHAGYVSAFLRIKYPQHEFLIGKESPIKIRDEAGHESRSSGLLEALLNHHTVTMEFPSGTPEAIEDYIRRYQSLALTHEEAVELREFSGKSAREEMARRIQLAGSGTQESLVTEVKKILPRYRNILDAVSARDTIVHERADAVENLKNATCHSADPEHLNLQVRMLRLRRVEGVMGEEISGEIMKLENASVPKSTEDRLVDLSAKDLFERLEYFAINPHHAPPISLLKEKLVAYESFRGVLARYLVVYLAKNGLPEMPKAQALLKSVWEALKNSLSSQPPTTLQPATSTAAPSTLIRTEDELATWFNPQMHTPAEFIDQWVTLQTQQAGLTGDYRNVSVGISYKTTESHVAGNFMASFTQGVTKHNSTLKLREIASRLYLKKKSKEGWDNFKIAWPSEFPTELRAKIEGGAWEDFKKFIVKFIDFDSFGRGANIIHLIAQGITGKKLDEWKGGEYKNRPRMVMFKARGLKTPLAGAFELDGRIYSIFNKTSYPAPQECKKDQNYERMIPELLAELVTAGMSENELDRIDNNPLQSWIALERNLLRERWPYLTYKECELGEFSRDMMNRFVKKFEDDMDRATYSNREQGWNTAAMFTELALGVVSLPIAAVSGPLVGAGLALLSTVPDIIRMAMADRREEAEQALNTLLLGLLFEVGGATIPHAMMKGFQKVAERKSGKLLQNIRTQAHAPVIKLEDLEDWAIGVREKIKGKPELSDADVEKLVDSSYARGDGAGSVNGESWLQNLGYTISERYQIPKKVVSKGSIGTVYEIDDNFLRKDYSGVLDESHPGRLTKAQNTVAAMNRLYGPDSAEVQIWNSANPLEKIVTVKMKRIPGESLDSLLKKGDIQVLNDVLIRYHESDPVNELVTSLSTNGINYNDINLANILFDQKTGKFHMVDFDDVDVLPNGEVLNPGKIQAMRNKFNHDFSEFKRSADKIRFQDLDAALTGGANNRVEFMKKYWGRKTYDELIGSVKTSTKKSNYSSKETNKAVDFFLIKEIKRIRYTDNFLKELRNRRFEDIPKVDAGYDEQVKDAADWIIGASNSKTEKPGWDAEIVSLLDSYAKSSEPINLTELEKIKTKLKLDAPERGLLSQNDASYGASATGKILLEKHLEAVDSLLLIKSANGGVDPNWHARQMLGGIIGAHAFGDGNGRLGRIAYAVLLLRAKKFSRLPKSVEDGLHGIKSRFRRDYI